MEKTLPDFIVVGSGAAGMTAALTGSMLGLKVKIFEKADVIGGTTSLSAGSVWIPNSIHSTPGADSEEKTRVYLSNTVGNRLKPALCDAFLKHGPAMISFLSDTDVKFRAYPKHPDYLADADGATLSGRALEPLPFNGARLGKDFSRLRDPLPEFTILGGMMVNRDDIANLLNATHKLASLTRSSQLLAGYAWDRLRFHRGTRLVMGNALVGRLYSALRKQGVPVDTNMNVTELIQKNNKVMGVKIDNGRQTLRELSKHGVILASGGFSRHPVLRKTLLPDPVPEFSPLPATITGDGVSIGMDAGGSIGHGHAENCFWTPVSIRKRKDGSTAVFPHFILDRGKPGLIAVDQSGRRFVNEATDYHSFGKAMFANKTRGTIPCHFLCDYKFIRKYGLGMVRPRASNLAELLLEGYVLKGATIFDLSKQLKIDTDGLLAEVKAQNEYARIGVDADFNKGQNPYECNLGDPQHTPNPCLGPIETPPFFAIKVYPGDLGASLGLVTDENARVLGRNDEPVPGLYACGNDMDSVMAGVYPGPGITIGPAMTFGYVAAKHIANNIS